MTPNTLFLNIILFKNTPYWRLGHFDPLNAQRALRAFFFTKNKPNNVFSSSRMGRKLYGEHPPPPWGLRKKNTKQAEPASFQFCLVCLKELVPMH